MCVSRTGALDLPSECKLFKRALDGNTTPATVLCVRTVTHSCIHSFVYVCMYVCMYAIDQLYVRVRVRAPQHNLAEFVRYTNTTQPTQHNTTQHDHTFLVCASLIRRVAH